LFFVVVVFVVVVVVVVVFFLNGAMIYSLPGFKPGVEKPLTFSLLLF